MKSPDISHENDIPIGLYIIQAGQINKSDPGDPFQQTIGGNKFILPGGFVISAAGITTSKTAGLVIMLPRNIQPISCSHFKLYISGGMVKAVILMHQSQAAMTEG